ncbi:MAG: alpha/beta fold hydrolase [Azospirillaceae bacterium]
MNGPRGAADHAHGDGMAAHGSPSPGPGASLAVARTPSARADGRPGVMVCPGFRSDMGGTKAVFLEARGRERGLAVTRFDYRGHGASPGRFEDGTIGDWAADALSVLDTATEGPQILVGSSMGAWIAVLVARARPDRVAGLVTVAAAPDFTEDLIRPALSAEARAALDRDGVWRRPSAYADEPDVITSRLLDEARDHLVLGDGPLALVMPLRALHGLADPDVPWRQSLRLVEAWGGADARLTLIKDGDHRLSRPADLALLDAAVAELAG